jgi:hypothetical protein
MAAFGCSLRPSVYRAVEFYALLASTHLDWDVRDNDMPAFETDQVCVAGRHHLESVSLHTTGRDGIGQA